MLQITKKSIHLIFFRREGNHRGSAAIQHQHAFKEFMFLTAGGSDVYFKIHLVGLQAEIWHRQLQMTLYTVITNHFMFNYEFHK